MKQALALVRSLWTSRQLRGKLLATLGLAALFRFFAHVPLLGVDLVQVRSLLQSNQLLGVLNIFSGGTLQNFSVTAVGMSPYITASILVQISGLFLPKVKEMQRESEATRAQLSQITRFLTLPVAVVQSLSLLLLLRSQGLLTANDPVQFIAMILSLVSGAVLVMWMSELITRYGIGNGTSWIIFLGIVSQIPLSLAQTWSLRGAVSTTTLVLLAAGLLALVLSVVFMNEAVRRVPIQQARRQRGSSVYGSSLSHLPLKVNQFGVMPIIFALPLLALPTTIGTLFINWSQSPVWLADQARLWQIWFTPGNTVYNTLYFILVFVFTFFSIYVYFQPQEFADDLKKSGTFIPGVRPGKPTAEFLVRVLSRVSFLGGAYLAVIALLPLLAQRFTGVTTLSLGGTGLLIVVSVVLETMRSVQAQLVEDKYDRYLEV